MERTHTHMHTHMHMHKLTLTKTYALILKSLHKSQPMAMTSRYLQLYNIFFTNLLIVIAITLYSKN